MDYVLPFAQIGIADRARVGGKNASLGEMLRQLTPLGVKIPDGFVTTVSAYKDFLKLNDLTVVIQTHLKNLNIKDVKAVNQASADIFQAFLKADLPLKICQEITLAYQLLDSAGQFSYAVRSSATAEDLPEASFAGQHETFLNVSGIEEIFIAVKKVFASLYTSRAIIYRFNHGFAHDKVYMSAGIQRMIRSDQAASGVIFTIDTESGFESAILITSTYGLGELLVQGAVNPDEFYVYKPMLKAGKPAILRRILGSKVHKMVYGSTGGEVVQCKVALQDQLHFSLSDKEILTLAKQALLIEEYYAKPMDIEWAKDGKDGELYVVQARPETVHAAKSHLIIEHFTLKSKGLVKTVGRSIGQQIGRGRARLISDPTMMEEVQEGDILVTDMTDPDWEPIMKKVAAIVTNRGGRTCHAAIVARELKIPAVVGCGNATTVIKDGESLTVSCAEGEKGYVYSGYLDYEIERTEIAHMPKIPVHISINLADPEQAFRCQFLPNNGVGLARIEFIINSMIGIHPKALLQFSTLSSDLQQQIIHKTCAYSSPVDFYITKLSEGIATIAAAFYPKPVIVRFSDFKSNEYAHLLGGDLFEPKEENPMLGYRGASRYISQNFRDCFALECQAVQLVREKMGLINVHIMFPFVRTLDEAQQLIALLAEQNLRRGHQGLGFYMMCEIPANVLLAEKFLELFDGFSIGSNDLTQLTLGLDRDSELVAHIFDERNDAVKILLKQAIEVAKRQNKYVGICGQAPSDYPDLAVWLMREGITALSLNPDVVISTWLMLAKSSGVDEFPA